MYKLSDASGKLTFSTISHGSLNKGALDSKDVFLVDGGKELYVWVGQGMYIYLFIFILLKSYYLFSRGVATHNFI